MAFAPLPTRIETERLVMTTQHLGDAQWLAEVFTARGGGAVSIEAATSRIVAMRRRTNTNGQLVTVKKGEPIESGTVLPAGLPGTGQSTSSGMVTPMGTVYGNCGTASVFIDNVRTQTYRIRTGWSTVSPSVSYGWAVDVTAPGYAKRHSWGGGLLLRSTWETSTTAGITLAQRGDFFAYANGTVTMSNGILCGSLHPTDIARIW